MPQHHFSRRYVILRPLGGSSGGFVCTESRQGRICMTIQANHLPCNTLRALLMTGDERTGALLDLGVMHAGPRGQAALYIDHLPAEYPCCHTLLLCSDWPRGELVLYGLLTAAPACTLWQMQEALRRYLCVPAPDTDLPEPAVLPDDEPPPPAGKSGSAQTLLRLPQVQWPASLEELRPYFDEFPPCAPLRRPGWRFVRIPLHNGPAPWCAVGIRIRNGCVAQVMYLLPGEPDHPPLQGYTREDDYWVHRVDTP